MSAPIVCQGLSKSFRRVSAIQELKLEVPEGSVFALVGPNGAGKTTLIKMLVNILRPSAGVCSVLGVDTRKFPAALWEQIGYVSENQTLPGWMTIDYFLRYLKPLYRKWDDHRAAKLMSEFSLPGGRRLRDLSRGMKMKAALASSLAYHPRLLILDEPFSGLDALVRNELIAGLARRSQDTTILVSSHDLDDLEGFATHIGYLEEGRLKFSEEKDALVERYREIEVTLPADADLPLNWPETWTTPQISGTMVRFIESNFDASRTKSVLSELFPNALHLSLNRMPLRNIFLALARGGR